MMTHQFIATEFPPDIKQKLELIKKFDVLSIVGSYILMNFLPFMVLVVTIIMNRKRLFLHLKIIYINYKAVNGYILEPEFKEEVYKMFDHAKDHDEGEEKAKGYWLKEWRIMQGFKNLKAWPEYRYYEEK